jgi:hypothetical protein
VQAGAGHGRRQAETAASVDTGKLANRPGCPVRSFPAKKSPARSPASPVLKPPLSPDGRHPHCSSASSQERDRMSNEQTIGLSAPASDGTSYAKKFSGKRTHRIIKGIGHSLPQEAPQAFAEAIVEVDGY